MYLSTSCRDAQVCLGFTTSQMSKQDAESLQNFIKNKLNFIKSKSIPHVRFGPKEWNSLLNQIQNSEFKI